MKGRLFGDHGLMNRSAARSGSRPRRQRIYYRDIKVSNESGIDVSEEELIVARFVIDKCIRPPS